MAKDETRRWRGWRTSQPPSEIKGSKPKKRPGARRKRKPQPWYWIKSKKAGKCESCDAGIVAGQVVAWSRPNRLRCGRCVRSTGLTVRTSKALAEERAERTPDAS